MGEQTKLPVGIENFEEIRSNGYYYIDKTKLIEQLLDNRGKVNLFTRPRRFGKTLNMSMLKCFFEMCIRDRGWKDEKDFRNEITVIDPGRSCCSRKYRRRRLCDLWV